MSSASRTLVALAVGAVVAVCALAAGLQGDHGQAAQSETQPAERQISREFTMEELHRNGGVPSGWKFTLLPGTAASGRRDFVELECYKCHAVAGETFPATVADPQHVGPELTGMGAHHPAEYFAESILNPNAVLLKGEGYLGSDGRSIMPSYVESLSVSQLVDLVAYLKSLTSEGPHTSSEHDHHSSH